MRKRLKKRGPKTAGRLGSTQIQILEKLATHDGWWSKDRQWKLGVRYRVTRILNSLVRRGLLSEAGEVYTLTVAGRQEIQRCKY